VFKRFGEKVAIPRVLATAGREWAGQMATYRERDSRGEEGYVLVCSPEPEAESLQRLLQALRAGHPRAHWPLRIESVDSLPWSANGKVSDTALAAIEEKKLHWRQRI
jgi:acyl-CoA synthetase (AMP-forming)/AMP-acid ligase II